MSINAISKVDRNNIYKVQSDKSSGKSDFSSYLGESKTLDSIFDKAAQKYNVSVNLLKAVGKAESNFNPKAVSRCGAQGIMQLMPATAASLGVVDSLNPEQNIMGGAKYISGLLKKYDGNINFALAAYNAGSGNVAKYGGVPPFKETRNYVKKINNFLKQGIDSEETAVSVNLSPAKDTAAVTSDATKTSADTNALNYSAPDITISLENSDSASENMNDIFNYNDYLEFLEKYLQLEKEEKEKGESNDYAFQQINYNVPVMNLINSIT